MLYLEDFLELMDQLPMELRDRFTEMRTLDLQMQSSRLQYGQDKISRNVESFFSMAANLQPSERQRRFQQLKKEYDEIMEHADEKISLANTMYDLVERYQRKLEEEAAKFRLELEADSPGLTAILEQKVREAELSNRQIRQDRKSHKKRRYPGGDLPRSATDSCLTDEMRHPTTSAHPSPQRRPGNLAGLGIRNVGMLGPPSGGAGPSSSIAAALTGRRDSFPSPPLLPPSASPMLGAASTAATAKGDFIHALAGEQSRHGRPRKPTSRVQEMMKESMEKRKDSDHRPLFNVPGLMEREGEGESEGDARRWCICNQTSYGEMVACDNPGCVFEWFHYECVNITAPPKGKWYCPHCTESLKRRKGLDF